MPSELFLDRPISNRRSVWLVFIIIMFLENLAFAAKSVDPDLMSLTTAYNLDLHYLQCPFSGY